MLLAACKVNNVRNCIIPIKNTVNQSLIVFAMRINCVNFYTKYWQK